MQSAVKRKSRPNGGWIFLCGRKNLDEQEVVQAGHLWFYRGALECDLGLPKRNGTRQRSRTCPNRMAVVAALHDPLTILLSDDFADVVTPDDDGPD
jgi:hypothetical protein